MKHYLLIILISFVALLSCNDDNTSYEVGKEFIDSNTLVFKVDTLSLETSTIISDSLITSATSRILIGALKDDDFGDLTAQSYFSVFTPTYSIDRDAVFDSISLIMFYDRYSYGDTTLVQTYRVHEITEVFEPDEDNDEYYFYNTSSLEYNDEILGEHSFKPYPNKKDSINIPLKYSFGENIFDKIVDKEIIDNTDFAREFRGVTVIPDSDTNTVLGFTHSTTETQTTLIRMYYTYKTDDTDENNQYYIDLKLNGGEEVFNNVTSDRSNTILNALTNSEDILPTSDTGNKAYLQSGTGIGMRVDMPTLETLNALENDGTTLNAELRIYPDHSSYDDIDLISSLAVYIINDKNETVAQLTNVSGEAVYAQINTNNDEFNSDTYYTIDVGGFVEQILTSTYTLDYSLRFEFPENTSTINRVLLNDPESPDNTNYKMKLYLTYLRF